MARASMPGHQPSGLLAAHLAALFYAPGCELLGAEVCQWLAFFLTCLDVLTVGALPVAPKRAGRSCTTL